MPMDRSTSPKGLTMTRPTPLTLRWTSTVDPRRGTPALRPVWRRRAA
jgi:hypothetical protein